MLKEAFMQFITNPAHVSIVIISWAISTLLFLYWKERKTVWLAYAHIFFFVTPLLYVAVQLPCNVPFIQGLIQWCSVVLTKFMLYLIPFALSGALLAGYFMVPRLYKWMYKAQPFTHKAVEKHAKAKLFLIDSAEPIAFSIRKNIFVSVGMHDVLTAKQLEAVLLHELGHVVHKSTNSKLSTMALRFISPMARFTTCNTVSEEERKADAFAVRMQKTSKHLTAAKQRVEQFYAF